MQQGQEAWRGKGRCERDRVVVKLTRFGHRGEGEDMANGDCQVSGLSGWEDGSTINTKRDLRERVRF